MALARDAQGRAFPAASAQMLLATETQGARDLAALESRRQEDIQRLERASESAAEQHEAEQAQLRGDHAAALAALRDLGRDLRPDEGVIIYPEGTRFTAAKRERRVAKLRKKQHDVAKKAARAATEADRERALAERKRVHAQLATALDELQYAIMLPCFLAVSIWGLLVCWNTFWRVWEYVFAHADAFHLRPIPLSVHRKEAARRARSRASTARSARALRRRRRR